MSIFDSFKTAYNAVEGDMHVARMQYEEEQLKQATLANNIMGNYLQNFQQVPKEAAPTIVGQLLLHGQLLPSDWRGAEYDTVRRNLEGSASRPFWQLQFTSKWSDEPIVVYLDAETVTGEDATAAAQTFLEVINQRRLG